jgi:putative flippase GtrA
MRIIPGSSSGQQFGVRVPVSRRPVLRNSSFSEIRKFGVVGLINTAVDLTVLNSLIFLTHIGRNGFWFSFFKGISFLVAVLNSYVINHSWTFGGSTGGRSAGQACQFVTVSLFGAAINISAASYVVTFISPLNGMVRYWPSVAALAGTACGLIFNFMGYKYIVFSQRRLFGSVALPAIPSVRVGATQADGD